MSQTSHCARRRVTVTRAQAAARRIFRQTARLLTANPAHQDADLLANCVAYGRIKRRYTQATRGTQSLSEKAHENAQTDLHSEGSTVLDLVAIQPAVTLDGHRARAAAILAWDEGELIGLVNGLGVLEDRLLLALLIDLVEA